MEKVLNSIIKSNFSIIEAIKVIENCGLRLAFVVDENLILLGVVSDGEIRRAILRGVNLTTSVSEIMNVKFHFATQKTSKKEILDKMHTFKIDYIPCIDENKKLIDFYSYDDLSHSKPLDNFVVIMAGGEGKRLRPLTENCPKPMLRIKNKPILEILLEQFQGNGFKNFYISVNYLKENIIDYFKDGSHLGLNINYIEEEKPLGTIGSLSLIKPKPNQDLIVVNGDVLTKIDYSNLLDFHKKNNAIATVCLREFQTTIPYGVVDIKNTEIKKFLEKPSIIIL